MVRRQALVRAALILALTFATSFAAAQEYEGQFAWGTSNHQEAALTPQSVSSGQFEKVFSYSVDGSVFAQPLYVPNVSIAG